jgi:isoleucyl-tRNA synthetase
VRLRFPGPRADAKTIGKSLEAKVALHTTDAELLRALRSTDLTALLMVSEAAVADAPPGPECAEFKGLSLRVEPSTHPKCLRCWNLRADVGAVAAHPDLCGRCARVIAS